MQEYLCVFPQFFVKHGRKRTAQNLPPPYLACPFGEAFLSVSEVEEAGEGELPLAALLLHLGLIIL